MDTAMGTHGPDDTRPENRQTLRIDRRGALVALLRTVRAKVERSPLGRSRRDSLGKLESLHAAVQRWELCPPQPEQMSAAYELLMGLHDAIPNDAEDRSPSGSPR
jgi:hypothetical protein